MISLILASLLSTGSPVVAEESAGKESASPKVEVVQQAASNAFQLGNEIVQKIRGNFNDGVYSDFLKGMDSDYTSAKKENELEGLIEIRKESARAQIHPEFARSYRTILDVKNQDLLNAINAAEDSVFVQKVKSAAASIPAYDETLLSLYSKVPGAGKNADENRLIDLDLEYYYKGIHLDSISADDRREKHISLEMEKIAKMLQASQSFEDKELKAAVEKTAAGLDERLARNYDMSDLNALARGKMKPSNPLEEKTASIVSKAQSELADLHRHLLDSLDENGQSAQN